MDNLIVIITGDGKGKTTSAVGQIIRAYGNGLKCAFIQFLKKEISGEVKTLIDNKIADHFIFGNGFTWLSENLEVDTQKVKDGWEQTKNILLSQKYDLVVLDEFTYTMNYKMIAENDILHFLKENRKILPHIFITGRDASDNITNIANTVSEIIDKKHHFTSDLPMQAGIEY